MTKYLIIFIFIISCTATTQAQVKDGEIPNSEISKPDIYSKQSLWGYMNGGSDLYFEYGFKKLVVQQIKIGNRSYTFRMFEMGSPKEAFGIFSIHRSKCNIKYNFKAPHCFGEQHIQLCYNNWYFSVYSNEKKIFTPKEITPLIEWIKQKYKYISIKPPKPLGRMTNETVMLTGSLSWQNYEDSWMDILPEKDCFYWTTKDRKQEEIYIEFQTDTAEEKFLNKFHNINKRSYTGKLGEKVYLLTKFKKCYRLTISK